MRRPGRRRRRLRSCASMNGEKALEDLRIGGAVVLVLDHRDQAPDRLLVGIARGDRLAAEPPLEAVVEGALGFLGDRGVVEEVVGRGVEQAVGEDRRGEPHREAEHHLGARHRPDVSTGLGDVFAAHRGVEPSCLPGELPRRLREAALEERVQVPIFEVERRLREVPAERRDAPLGGLPFAGRAGRGLELTEEPVDERSRARAPSSTALDA